MCLYAQMHKEYVYNQPVVQQRSDCEQDLSPESFLEPGGDRLHIQFWSQVRASPGSFFWLRMP